MNSILQTTLQHRKILYGILKHTPDEALLKIPRGYRNNVYWNIGHVVVTQQLLFYQRSNTPMIIPERLVERFKKGTVPDGKMVEAERAELATHLFTTIETSIKDFQAENFSDYKPFTTATKINITNIEDAIVFNLFHEGLHLGIILSLLKA